ncbi:MAG: phosphate acyltransferase PlsX [Candidatus Saganbacteria bacterium]|nr:phosphate acyltransferase PlsX [Candidatus Saganbacteria bacterium]
MRIAVDAMGGDHSPAETVKGAVAAAKEFSFQIILVGQEAVIKKELSKYPAFSNISIKNASETIGMDEAPASAVKQKKDSSLNVGIALVKNKEADGFVSAGNTGALMAAALFGLGRIKGIERPAIATVFPIADGRILLLDMGANVDCKPQHLQQFGRMGSLYAEKVLHIKNPRVGLLNIGEEKEKGNELTQAAWPLLKGSPINFIGNVESKEILSGTVDVVVCDGFVGNLILKFSESLAKHIINMLKKEVKKNLIAQLGALMLLPSLRNLRKMVDYDEQGGAPFLGVNGVCIKAHGRSKAKAIKNAIRVTGEAISENMITCLSASENK